MKRGARLADRSLRLIVLTSLLASSACAAAGRSPPLLPCEGQCVLELSNSTPFELDLRVAEPAVGTAQREIVAPGETRRLPLGSGLAPTVTLVAFRTPAETSPPTVRISCTEPLRGGDVFRSDCRVVAAGERPAPSRRDSTQAVQ